MRVPDPAGIIPVRSAEDRFATAFVWSTWLLMVAACFVALGLYGRDVPLTEGWQLVPALTGNEPDVARFLWAQNNEHRIPFPKLVLLVLLWLTGGDFRAGMFANIALLGAVSAALVRTARRVRGGRTIVADAVFPLGLLHLGHWNNLFWGWQLTQVLPTMLVVLLLCRMVRDPGFEGGPRSLLWGVAPLVLLPLCGANGLLFAPFFSAWVGYCGLLHLKRDRLARPESGTGEVLVGAAAVTLALTGIYFLGYVRPDWVPLNPGLGPSLLAAVQFVALGWGPVARSSWTLSVGFAALVLVPTAVLILRAVTRARDAERLPAVAMAVYASACAAFVLAMGWGRAGVIAVDRTWPGRYALFAFPLLAGSYFVWELYGSRRGRALVQTGLFAGLLLMLPLNTRHGVWFRDWYLTGADAVLSELEGGTTATVLSGRHRTWLDHASPRAVLADRMRMLGGAGVGDWPRLEDASEPTSEAFAAPSVELQVRYVASERSEVVLVWGLDGWRPLPELSLPEGTVIADSLMSTELVDGGGVFRGTVAAPVGSTVNYGFLTVRDASGVEVSRWDGDYGLVAESGAVVAPSRTEAATPSELTLSEPPPGESTPGEPRPGQPTPVEPTGAAPGTLVEREFRYEDRRAGEVYLVWGVDGWHTVEEAVDPGRTVLEGGVMRTRMSREGDIFAASVRAPLGSRMDYGFLTTDARGLFDLVEQRWDWSEEFPAAAGDREIISVQASVSLPDAWAETRERWAAWLTVILVFLAMWGISFLALGRVTQPLGLGRA